MERKLATILAMDVVGYARLMEMDEEGTLGRLMDARAAVIAPTIERYGGRLVKLMGDGALVEFASVVGALQCSVEIQRELALRNVAVGEKDRLDFRIGLHLGDVIIDGNDIYGDGVNVASRLEGLASPGGIVLSKQVHDHIGSNVPVRFASLGEQTVKNIARPIFAFCVDLDEGSPSHIFRFGRFELDTAHYELRESGERAPVEPQVFDLLVFLARNGHRTVTKEEIFAAIWGDRIVSDAALSSQIKAARRAVGDDGATQHTISTVHGRGFRFIARIERSTAAGGTDGRRPANILAQDTRRPAIALLPFANLNRDPGEDHFATGIAEDITTALAKHRWLIVVARNSAFAFRDSRDSLRIIGEKLGADYLVTGSVRKAGSRFRITIEVVDATTEQSIWSERFDRDSVDIFELQDEISETVASRLEAELGLTEQRKAERRPRKNLGSWDLYQLGTAEFYKFTAESNQKSQEYFREAIRLDPTFAGAYSRLAYAIVLSMIYFDVPPERARMDEALATAQRAIEFDDQDASGYFSLGRVHLARCEYEEAIDALEHAIELNPCLAVTYCGLGDSLAYEGRLDEAIGKFEVAIRLSPHDPFRWAFFSYRSLAHIFRGEFADAVLWARRAVQLPNAQYWARAHLVAALGHLGGTDHTEAAVEELLRLKPQFSLSFARSHLFYLKRADQLETYIAGLRKAGIA